MLAGRTTQAGTAGSAAINSDVRPAAVRALLKCCYPALQALVCGQGVREEHLGLPVSAIALADSEPQLAEALFARPLSTLALLDDALLDAQEAVIDSAKAAPAPADAMPALRMHDNVHVRLVGLPTALDPRPCNELRPALSRLGCAQLQQLLCVAGTVVRVGPLRMWESRQVHECTRCHERFLFRCPLEEGGVPQVPDECPALQRDGPCAGSNFKKVNEPGVFSGYQEVRLQESAACLGLGEPPAALTLVLQDELADALRPGDEVEVVGTLVARWGALIPGQRCDAELVLIANNITRRQGWQGQAPTLLLQQQQLAAGPGAAHAGGGGGGRHQATPEEAAMFEDFWAAHVACPMRGRNKLLSGVCPGVAGLLPVKLAAMLVLLGGVARSEEGGTNIRGELHLLMVGDPGTGKSQVMKWAARACPGRAVLTTGRGSSGAGLTVSAVREGSGWALEAGALVLADGGLCCIDEFDGIRGPERAVVHEAMEQQTVHVAKAGLVTSLSTRTSIIGAVNPRPGSSVTSRKPLTEVTGLEGPLLSRFDLVLLLADPRNPHWDAVVAGQVLNRGGPPPHAAPGGSGAAQQQQDSPWTLAVLRSYIAWARASLQPVLSPEAERLLVAYYGRLRQGEEVSASRATIRALESLIRMAQAHARLVGSTTVAVRDAVVAIVLTDSAIQLLHVPGSDAVLCCKFPDDPDAELDMQQRVVLSALGMASLRPQGSPQLTQQPPRRPLTGPSQRPSYSSYSQPGPPATSSQPPDPSQQLRLQEHGNAGVAGVAYPAPATQAAPGWAAAPSNQQQQQGPAGWVGATRAGPGSTLQTQCPPQDTGGQLGPGVGPGSGWGALLQGPGSEGVGLQAAEVRAGPATAGKAAPPAWPAAAGGRALVGSKRPCAGWPDGADDSGDGDDGDGGINGLGSAQRPNSAFW